jgi:hypothetical protein
MKVILTENQYNTLLLEYYDSEKIYLRERIVNSLMKGPQYIRQYIKKLPHIPVQDSNGNTVVGTKIPEVIYQYLYGNF